jgi:hypothetical protein
MSPQLRNVLAGAAAGVILSCARAPLGMDLTSVPATPALSSALFRALALLAVALGLGVRPHVPAWLLGATLGFGLHGLLLAPWVEVGGWPGLALALSLGVILAGLAAPRQDAGDTPPAAGGIERLGLAVAGAGCALVLETIARTLRLLGSGHTYDDTTFGFVLLAALALGAAAFGGMVANEKRAGAGLTVGLALAAATGLYSVQLLGEFSGRDGLDRFLRSPPWTFDLSQQGRLFGNLLVGGRVFLVPAFVLGAALCGARHRSQLGAVLGGGAVGLLFLPALIDGAPSSASELSLAAAQRVTTGARIAAAGGALALIGARARLARPALVLGLLGCAAAGAGAHFGPKARALPLSPWERFSISPDWIADTPEGLVTVEARSGSAAVVTLDRRNLTPMPEEGAADTQRFVIAHERLAPQARDGARVLLVGQLTPARAAILLQRGVARIDRTAAWHVVMPSIEAHLFADAQLPDGDVLAPSAAVEGLRADDYDLVIVPPVGGSPPRVDLPKTNARVVVWLYANEAIAERDWGEGVLLSSHGVDFLTVGVHDGSEGLPAGRAAAPPTPLWRARAWPFERETGNARAVTERLARAGAGTPSEALGRGLALHADVQQRSSPWDSRSQQTELSSESLALLAQAARTPGLDAEIGVFLTELWEGLALVLAEKREIDLIYEHVEPLAAELGPWPALERVLAYADLEMLRPKDAARRLGKVIEREPYDLTARLARAKALSEANDPAQAARELRFVLSVQPERRDVRRRLAVALVRAGEEEGRELIEELLREAPEDEELRPYLGPGPYPALPIEFTPTGRHEHD